MPETRWHYVSVRRGGRSSLLAGPFPTQGEAARWERRVRLLAARAADHQPFADRFGTCVAPTRQAGRWNAMLGVRVVEPWA